MCDDNEPQHYGPCNNRKYCFPAVVGTIAVRTSLLIVTVAPAGVQPDGALLASGAVWRTKFVPHTGHDKVTLSLPES